MHIERKNFVQLGYEKPGQAHFQLEECLQLCFYDIDRMDVPNKLNRNNLHTINFELESTSSN